MPPTVEAVVYSLAHVTTEATTVADVVTSPADEVETQTIRAAMPPPEVHTEMPVPTEMPSPTAAPPEFEEEEIPLLLPVPETLRDPPVPVPTEATVESSPTELPVPTQMPSPTSPGRQHVIEDVEIPTAIEMPTLKAPEEPEAQPLDTPGQLEDSRASPTEMPVPTEMISPTSLGEEEGEPCEETTAIPTATAIAPTVVPVGGDVEVHSSAAAVSSSAATQSPSELPVPTERPSPTEMPVPLRTIERTFTGSRPATTAVPSSPADLPEGLADFQGAQNDDLAQIDAGWDLPPQLWT
eukprot:s5418_g2.t1